MNNTPQERLFPTVVAAYADVISRQLCSVSDIDASAMPALTPPSCDRVTHARGLVILEQIRIATMAVS
jgi:hypothetical protein